MRNNMERNKKRNWYPISMISAFIGRMDQLVEVGIDLISINREGHIEILGII